MEPDERAPANGRPPSAAAPALLDGAGPALDGRPAELHLPLDMRAPTAARFLVQSYGDRVARPVLDDAELLMSELVTNSVRHSGAVRGGLIIRTQLTDTAFRLEVEDPGHLRIVAIRPASAETGGGFGLNLVQQLAARWGVERANGGGTKVWADLALAPAAAPA